MKIHKNHLRTAPLVTAYRVLQDLFTPAFISAPVNYERTEAQNNPGVTCTFTIVGFGHGIAVVSVGKDSVELHIKQFTCHGLGIAYAEFYESRHGNRELMTFLRPLLEAKLLPVLVEAL